MSELPDDVLLKAAREALERPSDFGYYGELPLFESWGITFTQTRDSDALNRSNYRRILADLQARAVHDDGDGAEDSDEYVQEIHCSHWAYGWADHIVVRVLENEDGPVEVDNLTATFIMAVGIGLYLRDEYPVYDESDYSELESEEDSEAFESEWGSMVGHWDTDDDGPEPTDTEREAVWEKLHECETPDGYWHEDLADMVRGMRPVVAETMPAIPVDPNQLNIF